MTPQTDLWLRMGRSWVTGNVKEDLVWYKTFASERSANHSVKVGWLLPLNRLTFNADTSYLRTRDRPGFEIDARSAAERAGLRRQRGDPRPAEDLRRHPRRSPDDQLRQRRDVRRRQPPRGAEPDGDRARR